MINGRMTLEISGACVSHFPILQSREDATRQLRLRLCAYLDPTLHWQITRIEHRNQRGTGIDARIVLVEITFEAPADS